MVGRIGNPSGLGPKTGTDDETVRNRLRMLAAGWRRSFLIEYFSDTVWPRVHKMGYQAVRTERWKYVRYTELEGMDELYDLQTDRYELKNVIAEPGARKALAEMKAELERLLRETR